VNGQAVGAYPARFEDLVVTALASAATPPFFLPADSGRFSWNIARGIAVWSDSVYRLHGYRPAQVVPSATLAFAHKHADDLHGCVDAVHAGMLANRLIVHEHRILNTGGEVRPVVMIARPVTAGQGRDRQLCGFLLPTNASPNPADDPTRLRGSAPLIPVLMRAFGVSKPTAHVLLAARRPLAAWRTPDQEASAHTYTDPGDNLRRTLEDSMFPLQHLILETVELAA
jgi:hypothetical protein